ncbi:pyridoxamine 5'-phosphate oxidase family protein [Corallococcus sp. bb12-1]|uniref:pyridoxamine 5'-phosphate oxidase family protein n=1 Tax=Corallococcus sp. bb12-1 TaxID=2996784 RepID=UPI00226F2CC7|nr:pyridoxamine 5'-phosphate oxidase family protein [Corallococcus sp. bb12-1]MCY1042633.1 pyridoxamine 5'-phosphate oxidase family protein [Corallococcus sp. bb12-1]
MSQVQSVEALEQLVGARVMGTLKSLDALDDHCVRLLSLSSFAVLGFIDEEGRARMTTVGGPKGFARVVDATRLRIDLPEPLSLNLTVGCGLLFFIPGLGETLRLNGRATLEGNTVHFSVEEAFAHCAKAFLRSGFWKPPVAIAPKPMGEVTEGPLRDPTLRDWLSRTPFVVVASWDGEGHADVSPRGDPAGFLRLEGTRVAVADRPGNRRTDTFHNVLEQPRVALLALIPGEDGVLELSGEASLSARPELLASMAVADKVPKIALLLEAHEARLGTSQAILASGLWSASQHVPAAQLPRMGEVFVDHVKRSKERGALAAAVRVLSSKRLMSWALNQGYKKTLY